MEIIFFKPESDDELLSFENNSSCNRIPNIGETVVISEKCYFVKDIVTRYKKLNHATYSVVSVILKELED